MNELLKKKGRKLTRDDLFKIIFQYSVLGGDLQKISKLYLESLNYNIKDSELLFIKNYVNGINDNIKEIESIITRNLENWDYNRIGNVEKALIIISTYETIKNELPVEIIANEAVELAKEYGDEKTFEFVNGVIGRIVNNIK